VFNACNDGLWAKAGTRAEGGREGPWAEASKEEGPRAQGAKTKGRGVVSKGKSAMGASLHPPGYWGWGAGLSRGRGQ